MWQGERKGEGWGKGRGDSSYKWRTSDRPIVDPTCRDPTSSVGHSWFAI